jgi:hypothetical protein
LDSLQPAVSREMVVIADVRDVMDLKLRPDEKYYGWADFVPPGREQTIVVQSGS